LPVEQAAEVLEAEAEAPEDSGHLGIVKHQAELLHHKQQLLHPLQLNTP
jgi:hypothetical protein